MLRAQSGASAPADTATKANPPPPPVNHLETALAGFKLTGYAAGSYAYSGRSSGDTIVGRLYDRLQNRFMLNALAVVLDKPYDPAKFSAGFHTELLVGQDATVIQSGGFFGSSTPADLPHLYVTLNVPTASGNGLQFKVGRIPTLLGLEVIETIANPNWSEGNQFIYVENFTGTGLSVETKFNNYVDVQFRVINGWDQVSDNNGRKSLMARVGLYPNALSSLGLTGYWGPEEAGNNNANRYGFEGLLWRKLGKTAVWVQGDYGAEQANAASCAVPVGIQSNLCPQAVELQSNGLLPERRVFPDKRFCKHARIREPSGRARRVVDSHRSSSVREHWRTAFHPVTGWPRCSRDVRSSASRPSTGIISGSSTKR